MAAKSMTYIASLAEVAKTTVSALMLKDYPEGKPKAVIVSGKPNGIRR